MPSNTADQQIPLPILADAANAQVGFASQTVPPMESRLVKRYVDVADRTARNGAPTAGEICFVTSVGLHFFWTGAIWAEIQPVHRRKLANQSVNNSTTFVNDNHLALPMQANATYTLDGFVFYDSSTTADIKFTFTVPVGSGSNVFGVAAASTAAAAANTTVELGVNGSITGQHPRGGIGIGTIMQGIFSGDVFTGATAGNLQLQWAQNTLDATNTTVRAGSWLRLQRVYT